MRITLKTALLFSQALCLAAPSIAQTLDFETLPDGTPTVDLQPISNQYAVAPFGVSFEVVDRNTGAFLSFPKIAKVGAPRTAFVGCGNAADTVVVNAGVCDSFLTDDDVLGSIGSLKVTYVSAVAGAAGTLLDVDVPGGSEQWTISAFDAAGNVLDVDIVDPIFTSPCGGPSGNGTASMWSLSTPGGQALITSILFEYTGTHSINDVGVAFDNFTPSESGLGASAVSCVPTANSTLGPALTFATGSEFASANQFRLTTQGLPSGEFGYYLTSQFVQITPMAGGSQGDLCLGGAFGRFNGFTEVQQSGACGVFDLVVDLTSVPTPFGRTSVVAGETWVFQCWYRDQNPTNTSNFSDAVTVTFQ